MARITKRQEAMQDLQRYKEILPQCENYEDRQFLINGIKNLSGWTDDWWELFRQLEREMPDDYSVTRLSRQCCLSRDELRWCRDGWGSTDNMKRVIVGLQYG